MTQQQSQSGELHLVRDVLDKQLVDPRHDPLGRADGITIVLQDDRPPRIATIECGAPVLARRISSRLERWVRSLGRRFGVRRGVPLRIPWRKVKSMGIEVEVDLIADQSPALRWEQWLQAHLHRFIPSIKPQQKKKH